MGYLSTQICTHLVSKMSRQYRLIQTGLLAEIIVYILNEKFIETFSGQYANQAHLVPSLDGGDKLE